VAGCFPAPCSQQRKNAHRTVATAATMLLNSSNRMEVKYSARCRFQERPRKEFISVVAASLCRGVLALLLPRARRHPLSPRLRRATQRRGYNASRLQDGYLLESNENRCRRRVAPLSRFAAAPEHRVMVSILSQRKPAGSQTD
jgi:hypothetical protein